MTPRLPTPTFSLGDTVYQRAAPEVRGMVTGLLFRPSGGIMYLVTWPIEHCVDETDHWECELTAEKGFGGEG